MKQRLLIGLLASLFTILGFSESRASHFMGGSITVEHIAANFYIVRLSMYRDCDGVGMDADYDITIASATCGISETLTLTQVGTPLDVSQICGSGTSSCDGGTDPGVQEYIYSAVYAFPCYADDWRLTFQDVARNLAIVNADAAGNNVGMFLETRLDNTDILNGNNSPSFFGLTVPYLCVGDTFTYNFGANDVDGDSLAYELVDAMDDDGVPVTYNPGYSATYPISTPTGAAGFNFNPNTGQMVFEPDVLGIFIVSVRVTEYRNGVEVGSVIRDVQFIVQPCSNTPPQASGGIDNLGGGVLADSNSVVVCAGSLLTFDITAEDTVDAADSVLLSSNVNLILPGATFTQTGDNPVTGTISWSPTLADVGYYTFSMQVEDNNCPIVSAFALLYDITVIDQGTEIQGPDTLIYCNSPLQLQATGGASYSWTPTAGLSDPNIANPTVSPAVATMYYVVTDNPCDTIDSVYIDIRPPFNITGSSDTVLCFGQTASLQVTPDVADVYTYDWQPAASLTAPTAPSTDATPTGTTTYIATVTNPQGCQRFDTVRVNVQTIPAPTVNWGVTNPYELCDSDTLELNAVVYTDTVVETFDPINNFLWEDIDGDIIDNTCGSFSGNALRFDGPGGPFRQATTTDFDYQNGGELIFWFATSTGSGTGGGCEPVDAGEEVVVEYSTDGGGTWITLTTLPINTTLTEYTVPVPAAGPNTRFRFRQLSYTVVDGDNWYFDQLQFVSNRTYTLQWTPATDISDATIANPDLFPDVSTTYTLRITDDLNGCVTDSVLQVNVSPDFTLNTTSDLAICNGGSALLQTQASIQPAGYTYSWTPTTGLSSATVRNPIADPNTTTEYFVTVVGPGNCTQEDSLTISVDPALAPSVETGNLNDTLVCAGGPAFVLEAGAQTVSLRDNFEGGEDPSMWTNLSGTQIYAPCAAGEGAEAMYFNANNGTERSATTVDMDLSGGSATITFDLFYPNQGHTCEGTDDLGEAVLLEYSTDNGATWTTIDTYDDNGYPTNDWYDITVVLPAGALTANTRFRWRQLDYNNGNGADGYDVWAIDDIEVTTAGSYSYNWSPAGDLSNTTVPNPSVTPTASNNYFVTVTDLGNNCERVEQVQVDVATVDAGPDQTTCPGGALNLMATPGIDSVTNFINEDFESGLAANWDIVSGAVAGNSCWVFEGSNSLTFNENDGTDRFAITKVMDLSTTIEATLQFRIYIPENGAAQPCEGANAGDNEDIEVDYTTDGGNSWTNLQTSVIGVAVENNWNLVSITLPPAVRTNNVQFRWRQPTYNDHVTNVYDTWAIDSVNVFGKINYGYVWSPNTEINDVNRIDPTINPTATRTYTVTLDVNGRCTTSDDMLATVAAPPLVTWTGAEDTDWFNANNWTPGCLPTCASDVVIPNVTPNFMPNLDGTISTGTGATNDFTVDAGATMNFVNDPRLEVCGHFTNNGLFLPLGTGTLAFVGNANQDYANPTADLLNNVEVDNGTTITLQNDMSLNAVAGLSWTGLGGVIVTGGNEVYVQNTATGSVAGYGNNSYVFGNLRRQVAGTPTYDFPVGANPAGLGYQLAQIDFTSAPTFSNLRAFFTGGTPAVTLIECGVEFTCPIAGHGKWVIDPPGGGTANYDITLFPRGGGAACAGEWTVVKQSTGAGNAWNFQGTACAGYRTGTPYPSVSRQGLSGFSEFAAFGSVLPLPVELLSFEVQPNGDHIDLNWQTTNEEQNNGFAIERSLDADSFTQVGWLDGNGTTNAVSNYNYPDYAVERGVTYYYRLRQEDQDGAEAYSNVLSAMLMDAGGIDKVLVYPNPASNRVQVQLSLDSEQYLSLDWYDITGRRLNNNEQYELEAGKHTLDLDISSLSEGVYFLRIGSQTEGQSIRVVVSR